VKNNAFDSKKARGILYQQTQPDIPEGSNLRHNYCW